MPQYDGSSWVCDSMDGKQGIRAVLPFSEGASVWRGRRVWEMAVEESALSLPACDTISKRQVVVALQEVRE